VIVHGKFTCLILGVSMCMYVPVKNLVFNDLLIKTISRQISFKFVIFIGT